MRRVPELPRNDSAPRGGVTCICRPSQDRKSDLPPTSKSNAQGPGSTLEPITQKSGNTGILLDYVLTVLSKVQAISPTNFSFSSPLGIL